MSILSNQPLFKECLQSLGASLLLEQEAEKMSAIFQLLYPITKWGKVDWEKIEKKIEIGYNPRDIISCLEKLTPSPINKNVYIEWDSGGIPVIKTQLDKIIMFFDDVCCVSFEKFIFNPEIGYIIEILPSYHMTVGIIHLTSAQIMPTEKLCI